MTIYDHHSPARGSSPGGGNPIRSGEAYFVSSYRVQKLVAGSRWLPVAAQNPAQPGFQRRAGSRWLPSGCRQPVAGSRLPVAARGAGR